MNTIVQNYGIAVNMQEAFVIDGRFSSLTFYAEIASFLAMTRGERRQ